MSNSLNHDARASARAFLCSGVDERAKCVARFIKGLAQSASIDRVLVCLR